MAFDLVPWAIEGASTDSALARVLANIASHDSEGINLPGDFRVTALGTPGSQVNIAPGGMVVRNVQAPGESYVGIARSDTLSDTFAPTSGAARSDLLIAQVIDPDFSPWQPYTDPNMILNGPYFQPVIISGVSPTVTKASEVVNYSAYAIARIDLPANMAAVAITDNMIADLRALANPRTSTVQAVQSIAATIRIDDTATNWTDFPAANTLQVTVPSWATKAIARIDLNPVLCDGNALDADFRLNLGGLLGSSTVIDYNQPGYITSATDALGIPVSMGAELDVTSLQGQTVTLKPQTKMFGGASGHTGTMRAYVGRTQVSFSVFFEETVA